VNYVTEITVPPQTPESAPLEFPLPAADGVISHVEIEFEKWCAYYLHLRIFYHEQQVYPLSLDEWYEADGETIKFDDYFDLNSEPFVLKVRAWNGDDSYEWTARVRITVLPRFVADTIYGRPTVKQREALLKAFGLLPEGD